MVRFVREAGMEGEVHQPVLLPRVHGRDAVDVAGGQPSLVHQPQPPAAFRDEQVAVRQERECPRLDEGVGERDDADARLLGGEERDGRRGRTKHDEGRERRAEPHQGQNRGDENGPHDRRSTA